jgi:hypothetical protein
MAFFYLTLQIGARDGITGKGRNDPAADGADGNDEESDDGFFEMWVDGMPIVESLKVLNDIKNISCSPFAGSI